MILEAFHTYTIPTSSSFFGKNSLTHEIKKICIDCSKKKSYDMVSSIIKIMLRTTGVCFKT